MSGWDSTRGKCHMRESSPAFVVHKPQQNCFKKDMFFFFLKEEVTCLFTYTNFRGTSFPIIHASRYPKFPKCPTNFHIIQYEIGFSWHKISVFKHSDFRIWTPILHVSNSYWVKINFTFYSDDYFWHKRDLKHVNGKFGF